ncbi:MAG TPA: HNH endonuclease signature motif containing protein, partial [Longimicrobium sp.]
MAIHYPEYRDGTIRATDNESTDPSDYPEGSVADYLKLLREISRGGGYILAEHELEGGLLYVAGRVDPRTPIEIIRGRWGAVNRMPVGRPAVLKGFHLRNPIIVTQSEISELLSVRPRRGTLHHWPSANGGVAELVEGNRSDAGTINQHQRAYAVWQELAEYARAGKPVTYGMLGKLTEIHHRALRYPLAIIEHYCQDNGLPPLSILVVEQGTHRPGSGFEAWDGEEFGTLATQVYTFDWSSYGNPFQFAADGTRPEELERALVADPTRAADVYALAKVRGTVQMLFRGALLEAYGRACAISGSTLEAGLEAAHILPWRHA